jgi:hypothetical protein
MITACKVIVSQYNTEYRSMFALLHSILFEDISMLKRERFLSLPGTFKPHFIPYFIACPKPGIEFPTLCIVVCFMLNEL